MALCLISLVPRGSPTSPQAPPCVGAADASGQSRGIRFNRLRGGETVLALPVGWIAGLDGEVLHLDVQGGLEVKLVPIIQPIARVGVGVGDRESPASGQPAHVRGTQAAQALRLREGLGFEPVDIWQLLERLEIPTALHEFGDDGGDGLYLWEDGRPFIVVNASTRASRRRFTAAHELGHHEMHRFETDQLWIVDEDISHSNDPREAEANAFAAYLLAPDEAVRRDIGGRSGDQLTETHRQQR
jgi:hypothetical protein